MRTRSGITIAASRLTITAMLGLVLV
ncbi:MAG: hypothetical protein JWO48_2829, partial [Bryobacterales bacterium]|nr:hypothetical protein [Bryobacterales bacterium]